MRSIKYYKKLREKKYILEEGKYIVEGEHLVEEAYKAGVLEEVLCTDENNIYDVPSNILSMQDLKSISLLKSVPDIMGVVRYKDSNNICGKRIVILDNVQDPGNVGTIVRSALAFNVDTVVLSEDSVSLYNDKMIRASEGTIFHMNVVRMNLSEAVKLIQEKGIKVYYADMDGNLILDECDFKEYAIVLGSEGQGISDYVKSVSDDSISIPISSNCESLNVSVTGGIIMYKFR